MNFYEITTITAAVFHLLLVGFVLSQNLRSSVNRVYALWGLALALWNWSGYMKYEAWQLGDKATGRWWLELLHLSVVVLPVSIYHLYFLIARVRKPIVLGTIYFFTACFAVSVFTPWYIRDVRGIDTNYGYVVEGGPAFYLFMVVYFLMGIVAIPTLYRHQKKLPLIHRNRLRALLLAYTVLVLSGLHDLVPVLGITHYPLLGFQIYPVGNLTAIFFGLVVAYSVLQHQMLNIHVTLSRSAAQLVRIMFIFLVGFVLLVVMRGLFPAASPQFSFFSSLLVLLVSAISTSVMFPRLFGKGEEALERRILGDRFEYQDRVQGFIQTIPFYADSELLISDLHDLLVNTIGVKSYQIILLDEARRVFSMFRAEPPAVQDQIPGLSVSSPIFHFFQVSKADFLAYKFAYALPGETEIEREARKVLAEFDPEFCFPLTAEGLPFGLLLIGEKRSSEPYTNQDIKLLVEMVKNLGLVLNQIRLKKQILLTEEMELMGTMSRGIAHDLNNLLTPVFTYLQLAEAGNQSEEMRTDLLPTALRNTETIRNYVSEALFFSKTQRLQLCTVPLDKVVQAAVAVAQPALKQKGIALSAETQPGIELEIDEVLIQRLIGNLISNAIDASPFGSKIKIQVLRLGKTETTRDWFRLCVSDQGEGISPDNLKKVITPYFTTKDRGSHTRGFGLGLAICRKIVHLHGGQITINSELHKGTKVNVDLPSRQMSQSGLAVGALT
jgi:signal transduction histidine kinase